MLPVNEPLNRDNILEFLSYFKGATIWLIYVNAGGVWQNKQWLVANDITVRKALILNSDINKYDLYFTPNGGYWDVHQDKTGIIHPYGKGRSKANALYYTSFSCDFDTTERIEEFEKFIKDPHDGWGINYTFKVQTKKGFHYHFIFEKPIPYKQFQVTYEQFCWIIEKYFYSDPATKDVSRYYRLPWSFYWKGKIENKQDVNIVEFNETARITQVQIEAIVRANKYSEKVEEETKNLLAQTSRTLYAQCQQIEIEGVIEKIWILTNGKYSLRGTHLVIDWEYLNWLVVWREENRVHDFTTAKIGTRPLGWVYNFVKMAFGWDLKKINYFFLHNYDINIEKILDNRRQFTSINWMNVVIDESENTTSIVQSVGKKTNSKMALNFSLAPVGIMEIDWEQVSVIKIMQKGKNIRTLKYVPDTFVKTKTMYRKVWGLTVNCTEREYDAIEEMINYDLARVGKKIHPNPSVWFNNRWRYILNWKQIALISNGKIVVKNINNYLYNDDYIDEQLSRPTIRKLHSWEYSAKNCENSLMKFCNKLSARYNKNKIIPAFLTIANSIFYYFYGWSILPYRPHLVMLWQTQSWKTTLLTDLQNVIPSFIKIASSSTPLSLLLAGVIWCPVFLTEFNREGAKRNDIYRMLNNSFDGDVYEKWQPNLQVRKFNLRGSFVIDTEFWLSNEMGSSRTRCVEILCSTEDYWKLDAFDWINKDEVKMGMLYKVVNTMYIWKSKEPKKTFDRLIRNFVKKTTKDFKLKIKKFNKNEKQIPEMERLATNYSVLYFVATVLYGNNEKLLNDTEKILIRCLREQAKSISVISVKTKTIWSFFAMLTDYLFYIRKIDDSELTSRITIIENWPEKALWIGANMFRWFVEKHYRQDLSQLLAPITNSNKIIDSPYQTIVEPKNLDAPERELLISFLKSFRKGLWLYSNPRKGVEKFILYIKNLWKK